MGTMRPRIRLSRILLRGRPGGAGGMAPYEALDDIDSEGGGDVVRCAGAR